MKKVYLIDYHEIYKYRVIFLTGAPLKITSFVRPSQKSPKSQLKVAWDESDAVRHLCQRLGVILIRDNMQMILSRAPDVPSSQITGEM